MTQVRTFLIAVGALYLANLIGTLPFSTLGLFGTMHPGVELHAGEPIFTLLQDAWAVIGLQLGAIGAVALWGARDLGRMGLLFRSSLQRKLLMASGIFTASCGVTKPCGSDMSRLAIYVMWIGLGLRAWRAVATNR